MSQANVNTTITTTMINYALVCSGVYEFARKTMEPLPEIFKQLHNNGNLGRLLNLQTPQWNTAIEQLAALAPDLPAPFGNLLRDQQLQLHEWFALALCGETESNHLLNLALAELQAPHGGERPQLHLLEAMSEALFVASLAPLQIATHRLLESGLLQLQGDGPLPGRELAMSAEMWALLRGANKPWLGCQRINEPPSTLPTLVTEELPNLATLLSENRARVIVLRGTAAVGRRIAQQLAQQCGLLPVEITFSQWQADPALAMACRYGGWLPVITLSLGPGENHHPEAQCLQQTPIIFLTGQEGGIDAAHCVEIDIPPLNRGERRLAWQQALNKAAAEHLADHALLDGPTIQALAERIRTGANAANTQQQPLHHLRRARANFGAERLRQLAQPVTRHVEAEGLILPASVQQQFDDLILRCRQREALWRGLGASLTDPNTGVRALFVGDSGAGKTLAASRLSTLLGAPLFRLDLAAIMNKYIGETEKNLGRTLDEAAAIDAVLLFDEADSLFGRRAEAKEAGERYANMLTNFLLSRIEAHPGIVVLTSNSQARIDAAFSRRFDAIIHFPLPGAEERYRLWCSHLGSRSPDENFCHLLADYSELPGGHIRNVVLNAAALSEAQHSAPINKRQMLEALRAEYEKLGRSMPEQLKELVD